MKKLMMTYLCETYPDAYTYRSKFGDILYDKNNGVYDMSLHVKRLKVVNQLVSLFCCSGYDADNAYENWKASRPVFGRVVNSTNETVIIQLKTECNTTV